MLARHGGVRGNRIKAVAGAGVAMQFCRHAGTHQAPGIVDAGRQCFEVHMPGRAKQRITDQSAPRFRFVFGKQAGSGLYHRGTRCWRADAEILPGRRTSG